MKVYNDRWIKTCLIIKSDEINVMTYRLFRSVILMEQPGHGKTGGFG